MSHETFDVPEPGVGFTVASMECPPDLKGIGVDVMPTDGLKLTARNEGICRDAISESCRLVRIEIGGVYVGRLVVRYDYADRILALLNGEAEKGGLEYPFRPDNVAAKKWDDADAEFEATEEGDSDGD